MSTQGQPGTTFERVGPALGVSARRRRAGATIPVVPTRPILPRDYADTLDAIKRRIQRARVRVAAAANSAMVLLYWDIGRQILARQNHEGWGAQVVDRLAADLRRAYPDLRGFSPRNLRFMRNLAEAYPNAEKVKQLVSLLPWGHVIRILQRLKAPDARDWYMRKSIAEGWSRNTLELRIDARAHNRNGKALTNFKATMPAADSVTAVQAFKDPYLFDFLGTDGARREREIEQALVDHIQRFLLELGQGFAFVGRQVQLSLPSRDYYLDLLFYHLELRCYVVIELKAVPFDPSFVGQINVYLSAVDDLLRHPDDKPTIGLLLCRSKERVEVEYALRDLKKPIGVAGWQTRLVEKLPRGLKGSLPTVEEFEAEFLRRRPL